MHTATQAVRVSRKKFWTGVVLSAIPVFMLLFSASMKLLQPPSLGPALLHLGYTNEVMVWIGVLEIAVALVYALPRTAVLGAVLVTGYLGGATATHVRVGDPFIMPVLLGVLAWVGLYLREERLKALLPLRK